MDIRDPFTVSGSIFLRSLVATPSMGWPLWVILAVGLSLILIGCLVDMRFLVLGLMTLLAVLPISVFFLLVNYMFASDMMVNILKHTVERISEGYRVRVFKKVFIDEDSPEDWEWIESSTLDLADSNIVKKKYFDEYEALYLKGGPVRILFIPRLTVS